MSQAGFMLGDAKGGVVDLPRDWRDDVFLLGFSKGLADLKTDRDLLSYLGVELRGLFQYVSSVELFILQPLSSELTPVGNGRAGSASLKLLTGLARGGMGGAPGRITDGARLYRSEAMPGHTSTMSVPVVLDQSAMALIVVQRTASAPDFTSSDLQSLTAVGDRVASVLPRINIMALTAAAGWLQNDMASAREIQRMLLPTLGSNFGTVRVVSEYSPAYAVGGDFYDLLDLQDGRLLGMIGDVSGKGVAAALMMSRVSSELRQLASQKVSPADMLTRVNASLQERTRDDRFVTVVCVSLDAKARRCVVANAGHVVPMLRRANGSVIRLSYPSGPPLGMVPRHIYSQQEFALQPRDIIILVTDGVFETIDGQREPCSTMGTCRLTDLIAHAPHDIGEIRRHILDAVGTAAGGPPDDVALLGMELTE
jgi:sigma-B regulation protein RsbU (phosphoserine phosphatase)